MERGMKMKLGKLAKTRLKPISLGLWGIAVLAILVFAVSGGTVWAQSQSPAPAATGNAPSTAPKDGFTPGWGYGVKFEGSTSDDGTVTDLGSGVGYNFSRHFGMDVGVPFYFIGTPSSIKGKNPNAVSGYGFGDVGGDLKWIYPNHVLTYAPTIHVG